MLVTQTLGIEEGHHQLHCNDRLLLSYLFLMGESYDSVTIRTPALKVGGNGTSKFHGRWRCCWKNRDRRQNILTILDNFQCEWPSAGWLNGAVPKCCSVISGLSCYGESSEHYSRSGPSLYWSSFIVIDGSLTTRAIIVFLLISVV